MLAWTVYLSFLGVVGVLALKPADARGARIVAMLSSGASLVNHTVLEMREGLKL